MNKVYLIGRLTKDPELKTTAQSNLSVCKFTIAVNRDFKSANGETQSDFINCIAWRNQAENLCKFQKKGSLIAIDGSIQVSSYQEQNGNTKYSTDVVANHIEFLGGVKKEENTNANNFSNVSNSQPPKQSMPFENTIPNNSDITSDDLPF